MSWSKRVSDCWRAHSAKLVLSGVVLFFCTAPTPGDVGGCGQKPAELDPEIFFSSKANIDCRRCAECGLAGAICRDACAFSQLSSTFPADCVPLVHDGEVCLRALLNASCEDYAEYTSESRPTAPTECNFCPEPRP